ncbi:mannosyl-oligosaccharide 1,2-alpha-mannosidase MNS3 [Olea europaea subsp. europaea]|uniref:alpha-1,2-Mannosidase n=1 Tax=Olea europaea subsp. europaea TaxID=158383 RepID=A0A8S0RVN9_OLEEU|nr:mannosyl-oligosaccharide 1,2-alpha-mannosidase MNS3 [Olea europaea subsp. europaea]
MSKSLPYSMKDVHYDNAKFRQRSFFKVITQNMLTSNRKRECVKCTTGKFLTLLMICGLAYLMLTRMSSIHPSTDSTAKNAGDQQGEKLIADGSGRLGRLWRKPPRLPPLLTPDEITSRNRTIHKSGNLNVELDWKARQQRVKEAFIHAWLGYKNYAMGYDELMPLSHRGVDGLGGLGATIIDALDTAMIMGADEVINEAGSWIEKILPERIDGKGQVNLFETTIRIMGGLLSAYHLSGGEQGSNASQNGTKPVVYLENARKLADHLLIAFTSSPSAIPFSDVVLHDRSAHPAPDGLSSTSEVSTLQLEFNYLSSLTGDPKYSLESMKVLEHLKTLPKVEGLVPIYISPHSGEFSGENIRLGSRGDSYYEYLIKVWLQNQGSNLTYLHNMYEESIKGVKHLLVRKSVPNGLVFVGELPYGPQGSFSPKMDHLVCFLPGTLALGATKGITKEKAMRENLLSFEDLENLKLAEDLAMTCVEMYSVTSTGLAPEIAYFNMEGESESGPGGGNKDSKYAKDIIIKPADRHNLLRPETVESLFFLFRITEDPKYREWGWEIFEAFEKYTKVDSGGYSSLDDVTTVPPQRRDKMETFFLGETLKYLYLLFGDTNVLALDEYVFNSEAHPFPIHGGSRKHRGFQQDKSILS